MAETENLFIPECHANTIPAHRKNSHNMYPKTRYRAHIMLNMYPKTANRVHICLTKKRIKVKFKFQTQPRALTHSQTYIHTNIQIFFVILKGFYNLFIYKRFDRKVKIKVTNWQPCLFLRFAVSCCQCLSSWYKSNNKQRI